jgi:serine/threonine-protein kinase
MAEQAANKSMKLAPSLPHIHLALSFYHIWAARDPNKALEELEIAEEKLPNNPEVLIAKTSIYELLGQFDEAIAAYNRAFELSPRDANIPTNLLFIYWITRRHEQAVETANQAIALAPNELWPYLGKTFAIWQWKGATQEARMALESVSVQHPWLHWAWFWQEMYEGRYTEALDRLSQSSEDWIRLKTWARPKKLFAAYAYQLLNMPSKAKRAFESAKVMLEGELQLWPQDPRLHSSLGIACAALGEKDKAIREGKHAVELLPISKDAIYGWPYLQDLAHIYVLAGEYEAAFDQIEYMLSITCWFSTTYLKIDPRWNPLRDHPRYKEILDKYRQE